MQPTQQRQREVRASNILYVGFIVSLCLWHIHLYQHPFPKPVNWWVLAVTYALIASWYFAIRLGKKWAQYLLLVLFIGSLLMSVAYHPERILATWRTSWLAALSNLVSYGAQLWALVLLFWKPHPQAAV